MRINLAIEKRKNTLPGKFLDEMTRQFHEEYDFKNRATTTAYVTNGKQGLTALVNFIKRQGYNIDMYYLEPNKELFSNVGEDWQDVSRYSPSFGFIIPDDDPMLVEFKLKHL